MSNPNNISSNICHDLHFIDGQALKIPTFSILTDDGFTHKNAITP
jgi:2-oxoisovalerate dehydrogenase E1 component alpha subunit